MGMARSIMVARGGINHRHADFQFHYRSSMKATVGRSLLGLPFRDFLKIAKDLIRYRPGGRCTARTDVAMLVLNGLGDLR